MNFVIQKGIRHPLVQPKWTSLFNYMKVGDSILMTSRDAHRFQVAIGTLRGRSQQTCRLTIRSEGSGQYRVWKVLESTMGRYKDQWRGNVIADENVGRLV